MDTQAPVQMTRAEYQAQYGAPPPDPVNAPIKMTRAEYNAKYGVAPGEAQPTPSQQADTESAQRTGAFFPADTKNESKVAGAAKTVANIIPSAWNFAKGAVDMVNPISTAKKIGQGATEMGGLEGEKQQEAESKGITADLQNRLIAQYQQKKASGADVSHLDSFFRDNGIDPTKTATPMPTATAVHSVIQGEPAAAYETVVPKAAQGAVTAIHGAVTGNDGEVDQGLDTARREVENDPVGSILPFLMGAKAISEKAGVGAGFDKTMETVAKPVTTPASYAFGKVADATGHVVDAANWGARNLTGLDKSTTQFAAENPSIDIRNIDRPTLGNEIQTALAKRSADMAETGGQYKPIRDSQTPINVEPDFLHNTIQDVTGMKVGEDGKIETNPSAKIRDPKDVRAVQNFHDTYQPLFDSGKMTTNEFLNMRTDLAKLSKFDRDIGKSTDLEASAQQMRGRLNTAYRPQVDGLQKLDEQFAPQISEFKTLSKGLVDKDGHLTDAGLRKLSTVNENKPELAAKLEQISPGFMKKVQQLRASEDLKAAADKYKTGTYSRTLGQSGFIIGGVMLNPIVVGASIAELIASNPDNAIKLIQKYGKYKPVIDAAVARLKGAGSSVNALPDTLTKPKAGAFSGKGK